MVRRKPMTRRQQKAMFSFFSYVNGRKLGSFSNMQQVFRKHPRERKAFKKVQTFNKRTGLNIKTVRQIRPMKRQLKVSRRWDQ